MRYLKWSIVLIGLCGGVSGIAAGNIIHSVNNSVLTLAASLATVAVMLLFMVLAPLLVQEQYYGDWARDSEMSEIDNDQLYLFRKYRLSKRETEVCRLLYRVIPSPDIGHFVNLILHREYVLHLCIPKTEHQQPGRADDYVQRLHSKVTALEQCASLELVRRFFMSSCLLPNCPKRVCGICWNKEIRERGARRCRGLIKPAQ